MIDIRVGLYQSSQHGVSHGVPVLVRHLVAELERLGVTFIPFRSEDVLPNDVDLYWDPSATAGSCPYSGLLGSKHRSVVTMVDLLNFSVAPTELKETPVAILVQFFRSYRMRRKWTPPQRSYAAYISISEYVRQEAIRHVGLDPNKIFAAHLGVDHAVFRPGPNVTAVNPYLFHASNHRPSKNYKRVISAYLKLPEATRPRLMMLMPGYERPSPHPHIEIITEYVATDRLVELYQNALGFIFPSLHEGFGLPVIEAMACGCPVLTSNVTACPEVAGDAALLVNPRDSAAITDGMQRLVDDETLRTQLRIKGISRAAQFTWTRTAREYLKIFERIASI